MARMQRKPAQKEKSNKAGTQKQDIEERNQELGEQRPPHKKEVTQGKVRSFIRVLWPICKNVLN